MKRGNITAAATKRPPSSLGKWWMTPFGFGKNAQCTISCGWCAVLVSTSLAEHSGIAEGTKKWAAFQEEAKIVEPIPYGKKGRNTGLNQSQQVKLIWTINSHAFAARELLIKHVGLWFKNRWKTKLVQWRIGDCSLRIGRIWWQAVRHSPVQGKSHLHFANSCLCKNLCMTLLFPRALLCSFHRKQLSRWLASVWHSLVCTMRFFFLIISDLFLIEVIF